MVLTFWRISLSPTALWWLAGCCAPVTHHSLLSFSLGVLCVQSEQGRPELVNSVSHGADGWARFALDLPKPHCRLV